MIEIFSKLNTTLTKGIPDEICAAAIAENCWFSAEQIQMAAEAISRTMLQQEELMQWLSRYELPSTQKERVLIVMAGNIPFVGFFDLLCVLAAGHCAVVKCSHKDRVLMEWIISQILRIEATAPIHIYKDGEPIDRVIATGGDAAVSYFKHIYNDKPSLLRGARHSAAVVTGRTSEEELKGLSRDIYSHSGLGCRNVSLIFIPKGYNPLKIPNDTVSTNPKYRNNYLQSRAIYTLSGIEFTDNAISCFVASDQFPSSLSTISVVEYDSMEEVTQWLSDHDEELQCVVASEGAIRHTRRCSFGESQYPTLYDYADGVDTMIFLSTK